MKPGGIKTNFTMKPGGEKKHFKREIYTMKPGGEKKNLAPFIVVVHVLPVARSFTLTVTGELRN